MQQSPQAQIIGNMPTSLKGAWAIRTRTNQPSCDGRHIGSSAQHLASHPSVRGGCDMVADWIVIYAVLFVLGAVIVGRIPEEG